MQILKLTGKPHPHIVETLGAFQYGDTFSIVFPLAESNLEDYLGTEQPFTSDYLWEQMQGISDGLAYLHGLQDDDVDEGSKKGKNEHPKDYIVMAYHLDLKPENILIMNGKMQIADFGLSKVQSKLLQERYRYDSSGPWEEAGYKPYAPPEYLGTGPKNYAGHDIFSLGGIFSEVATHDIRLTDKETSKGRVSVQEYRTRRMMDEESSVLYRSQSFYNGDKMKKSVHDQHELLLKAGRDAEDTELWQSIFYQKPFLELITQMLTLDPRQRGTANYVANTLKTLLEDTKEKQKNFSSHMREPSRVAPTIWEEAESGKLQIDYEKLKDAPFL